MPPLAPPSSVKMPKANLPPRDDDNVANNDDPDNNRRQR